MDEIDQTDRDVERIPRHHSAEELPYVIHKRNRSPNYWMRFSIKGHGQQRFGLGTADLDEAKEIAGQKYQEAIIKAKHGILEGVTSFDRLAKEYVASLFKEADTDPNRLSNAKYAERICRTTSFKPLTLTLMRSMKNFRVDCRKTINESAFL